MGLPKISHPTFSLVLPSTQQKVTFRPFLVKEEKILLIAQASGDQTDVVRAIKQVISNCLIDPTVDVERFTTFDLEYFFIKLRSKSVQNIVKLSYKDNEDNKIYEVEVNLEEVEVFKPIEVSKTVQISDTSSINLKYPQISIMNSVEKINDPVEFNFAIMQACIDTVKDNDVEYVAETFTVEEVREFLESLDVQTYQKIQEFIEAMPRVEHTISYTNSLGRKVDIVLRNLTDFFTLG